MTRAFGRWRVWPVAVGLSLGLAGAGCSAIAAPDPPVSAGSATGSASGSAATPGGGPSAGSSGLHTCALTSLPAQADEVVDDIHAGGPFAFPRNDGVTFGNREGELPKKASRYYREYTVTTPGSRTRGARRIVTGGQPATDPPQYFYTGDHYASFCEITGANR